MFAFVKTAMLIALQGEAQCCVTGAAFEHILQLGDHALLEAVMSNVVVFSRMKSHQKGQVMDLLGTRGLYQTIQGQRQHIPVRLLPHLPLFLLPLHLNMLVCQMHSTVT